MKPDKIFVSSDPFGFMSAYDMGHHPPHGEEYIRKDALLEWAKEKKTCLEKLFDIIPASALGAKIDVCSELIDKLNSM